MPSTTSDDVCKVIGAMARPWWKRAVWIVAAIAAVLAVGLLVVRAKRGAAASAAPAFELAEARRGDVKVTVTATGTLQSVTTVEVGAEVTGKVLSVRVDANDAVKKGQILAEIDPEQLRAAVDEAAAQVSSASPPEPRSPRPISRAARRCACSAPRCAASSSARKIRSARASVSALFRAP